MLGLGGIGSRGGLRELRGRAVDAGYAAGWGAVRALPVAVSGRAFAVGADLAAARDGSGTQQLRRNLRRVLGPSAPERDLDRLVRAGLRSYSRYWLETFRLPSMDHAAVCAALDRNATGVQHIHAGLERGKGVILALPHSGNWDVSGLWLTRGIAPFTTVAERLEPASLFDRFVAYRESLGMEVIALTGGERTPTDVLTERLRANGIVCLLADRDLSRTGIEVQFFGEATRLPPGPSLLAAKTGAALLAVQPFYTPDGWGHTVSAPIEATGRRLRDVVVAGTQALADHFADGIAAHPQDWHMLQRLWLADLPARAG